MFRMRKQSAASEVELPVTPMLDMTFQLLAFFIFTYQPSAIEEGQLAFSLPAQTAAAGPSGTETAEPTPDEVMPPGRLTVVLKAQHDGIHDGALSAVIVQIPEGETAFGNLAQLKKFLKSRRPDGVSGKDDIRVQAETRLKYGYVIEAMDTCIQSGFPRVGLAAPLD